MRYQRDISIWPVASSVRGLVLAQMSGVVCVPRWEPANHKLDLRDTVPCEGLTSGYLSGYLSVLLKILLLLSLSKMCFEVLLEQNKTKERKSKDISVKAERDYCILVARDIKKCSPSLGS